jgi:methionyl-tRNA formyltransferase
MRVIFLCGHKSPYGLAHLEPLLHSDFEIIAVVLATDKRWNIFRDKLSGKNFHPNKGFISNKYGMLRTFLRNFKIKKTTDLVKKYKIPIWYEDDINSTREFIPKLKTNKIDLIISAAYPQIFSGELISTPLKGSVNFHPSLLPKFRGAHPHYWSIVKGEAESGITAHFMTENIDEGDIIAQIKFPIENYDYQQLYTKIITETPSLIKKVEDFFLKERSEAIKQDPLMASYFRNDRDIHHRIFWRIHKAHEIINLVRGGNAFCFFRNSKIVVEKCFITDTNRNLTNGIMIENGTIIDLYQDGIAVSANLGIVNITKLIYNGKKMGFLEFIIKYKPLIGERFE